MNHRATKMRKEGGSYIKTINKVTQITNYIGENLEWFS